MIKVTGGATSDCEGLSRRNFVQAGVLGLGGLTLSDLLSLRAHAGSSDIADMTSVILFWLSGGPGHMETWDPKPEAITEFRGPFGAIQTNVPGVQFGELLPRQAKIADKLAVLRTVRHGSGDHTKGNHWMLTGFEGPDFNAPDNRIQRRPAMGSAVAAALGANRTGMPAYAAVPHLRGGTDNLFHYATYLGGSANPFVVNSDPNEARFRVRNLSLPGEMPFERLESRREVLSALDAFRKRSDQRLNDLTDHQSRAFELLTSQSVRTAFDISAEPGGLRNKYGRHTFGQSALLARRLVESGVTFVTVNCVPWDHHGTSGRYKTEEGARKLIPPFDRALAALVEDLVDRGMFERTLVVAMGEFGRTPRMNSAGGRDHWGHTFSVLMAGGRYKMGQVVGKSSARGEQVVDRPLDPQDVAATVYHHLGVDARSVSFPDQLGREIYLLTHGEPVRELIA